MKNNLIKIIASCFFIGYIPVASGTASSLAALFLYAFIADSTLIYSVCTSLFLIIGFLISPEAEAVFKVKDSPKIVIDEFAAMLVAFFKIPPTLFYLVLGFFLFRIFDVIKPYPADKIEKFNSKVSIMGDDIIVAVYTNLILQFVLIFAKIF